MNNQRTRLSSLPGLPRELYHSPLGPFVCAALCIFLSLAMANEPDIDRLVDRRATVVGSSVRTRDRCRILNTVTGEHAQVVRTAIGQLNDYLVANHGVTLPVESLGSLPTHGSWIVAAAGVRAVRVLDLVGPVENIGDQGFVIRQVAAPSRDGTLVDCVGKDAARLPLWSDRAACDRFSPRETRASRNSPTCATSQRFPGAHTTTTLANICSTPIASTCCTTCRSHDGHRADWRRFLEMIAAMRYTTYELWLSPTFFSAESLTAGAGSKFDAYANTIRRSH